MTRKQARALAAEMLADAKADAMRELAFAAEARGVCPRHPSERVSTGGYPMFDGHCGACEAAMEVGL